MSTPRVRVVDGRKPCSVCRESLPVDSFGLDPRASSGLKSPCRKCAAAMARHPEVRARKRELRAVRNAGKPKCVGPAHHRWTGGRQITSPSHGCRYVKVPSPRHVRAVRGYVFEHVLIVENALGHELRRSAEVHHVDGNGLNNAPTNLVACHDLAYHKLLHRRQRALDACGNADWRSCVYCKTHDAPERLVFRGVRVQAVYHLKCHAEYENDRRCLRRVVALARKRR